MKIRYVGTSTRRIFDRYTFDRFAPDSLAQEVSEVDVIREMLTQPGIDFAVDAADPLAQIVGVEKAAELAVFEGITTPEAYRERYGAPGKKIFIEEVRPRREAIE